MERIKIGILGYGNLGKGVECAIKQNDDMELAGVFTRRNPKDIKIMTEGVKVFSADALDSHCGIDKAGLRPDIDVLIACGGSATDLPVQTPRYAKLYNIVDSYDNHNKIPQHFAAVDKAASEGGKIGIISCGWDPGLFSLNRAIATSVLPSGENYTFWGIGVSQGHSDAIRRIKGVKDARQYTIPIDAAVKAVRSGENPVLTAGDKHIRECFVVAEEGADNERITKEIVTMPDYFDEYSTSVHFISEEEMTANHSGLPHGGMVIRSGKTGWEESNTSVYEFKLKLDSNPEFCTGVLIAYARAAYHMNRRGDKGCKTVFDIPVSYLFGGTRQELLKLL